MARLAFSRLTQSSSLHQFLVQTPHAVAICRRQGGGQEKCGALRRIRFWGNHGFPILHFDAVYPIDTDGNAGIFVESFGEVKVFDNIEVSVWKWAVTERDDLNRLQSQIPVREGWFDRREAIK